MGNVKPSDDIVVTPSGVRIERKIKLGDTTYELGVRRCTCGHPVYRLIRTCGAALSVFDISEDDYHNLDEYVAELHSSYAIDVTTRLETIRDAIAAANENGLFEAHGLHPSRVRMIDRARLILNRLSRNGRLQEILDHADNIDNDIAAAFVLGCIATDAHWLEVHEEAVFEGYAHIEGRETGRPLAVAARRRHGKRTRSAISGAASRLYQEDPELRRNDAKTAARIVSLKLEALRKRDGTYLGAEAIVKHLRAARCGSQNGKSQ